MNETTDFSNLQSVLDLYGATIDYGVLYEDNANNMIKQLEKDGYKPFILKATI